jgi:hypothetical protein
MNTPDLQALMSDLIADASALARHEAEALARHRDAVQARWRVARRTRTLPELLRHQLDLLPLTRRRLADDHQRRLQLLRRLLDRFADSDHVSPGY